MLETQSILFLPGDNWKFTPPVGPPVGERCSECNFKFHVGGPIWSEPIHDIQFVQRVYEATLRNKEQEDCQLTVGTTDR